MCGYQKTTWLLFILTVTSSVSCVMLPTPRTADCITAELVNYNASKLVIVQFGFIVFAFKVTWHISNS